MNTPWCELLRYLYAAITKYAAVHVQLDLITNIDHFIFAPFEFKTGICFSVLVTQVLELALPRLIANRTIQGVIDEQKFNNPVSCLDIFSRKIIFYFHP